MEEMYSFERKGTVSKPSRPSKKSMCPMVGMFVEECNTCRPAPPQYETCSHSSKRT